MVSEGLLSAYVGLGNEKRAAVAILRLFGNILKLTGFKLSC